MPTAKTIARLFQESPTRWGLRGDPYLWQDMRATLSSYVYPSTEAQLNGLLEQTY